MQWPRWMPFVSRPQQVESPAPRPPFGEISLRDSELYPRGLKIYPYNPDQLVQRKGGFTVFDNMRKDEMVKSCQYIKKLAVLCSGWDVHPASDETADIEIADFVTEALKQIPGTLEEKIKEILTAMDYGFSVTEKVWKYIERGDFVGKLGVALKTRKPHRFDFQTDEFGNLLSDGLWQESGTYKYDPKKFVLYAHNREFDNWYGNSDLSGVYRPWWSKDCIIKLWNIYLERFGNGGIPTLHPREGGKNIDSGVYDVLRQALDNLQSKSVISWNEPNAIIELLQTKGGGQHSDYQGSVQYHDRAIGRGLLMPTGLGFSEDEKQGSYARSQTHFNMWLWLMNDLRRIVEETIVQEQVINDLVFYNYGPNAIAPRFAFMPFDDGEKLELAKMWLEAVTGKAVHPDAEDEIHFRRVIEFPERDAEDLQAEIDEEKENRDALSDLLSDQRKEPEEDDDKKPKLRAAQRSFEKRWHRKLSKFEKRVDFAAIEKDLNEIEAETRERLIEILGKQREAIVETFHKATGNGKIDMTWVNAFSLRYGVEFMSTLREFMRTAFEMGRRDSRIEIASARDKQLRMFILKFPPRETVKQLEKAAFWIKNVLFDGLVKAIQGLLINFIETGETPNETAMKIRSVYEPYIGDEQVVRDQRQIEPYRIETVVRTNATKAYNRGRVVEFVDPDLDGFVRAVELSAILDERTTDICRAADGKIVRLDDEQNLARLTPPLHYNCRSILVPVTQVDGEFEPTRQADLAQIKGLMPKEFGGDVDR